MQDRQALLDKIEALSKENLSLQRKCDALEDDLGGVLSQLPRLRQMIEYSSDLLLLVDETGIVLDCNRATTEALALPRDGLYGVKLSEIWSDPGQILNRFSNSKTHATMQIGELLCGDGSRIPVETHVVLFKEGEQSFALAAARDIRERQEHELALRSMSAQLAIAEKRRQLDQEMQLNNRWEALGELSGGIAHDFNNIFLVVLGNLNLLEELDCEEWPDCIADARTGLLQATRLSTQLLTFASGGSLLRKTIDIDTWLHGAAHFALSGSSHTLAFEFSSKDATIEVDEGQMTQVLHNLLHNAQDAMVTDGTVSLRTTLTPRGVECGDLELKIFVQDQGSGIRPEHRDSVFDPYFTTKEKGTGIGLATSYRIVRDHGGSLSLMDRQLSKGECFCITLPAKSSTLKCPDSDVAQCA